MTAVQSLHLVLVPTTDPDRSISFYESLGFDKRVDNPFGPGGRWIEMFPPEGPTGISLVAAWPGDAQPVRSAVIVTTADIDACRALLQDRGLDVDPAVARAGAATPIRIGAVELTEPEPAMFWVRDTDGNGVLVVGS